VLLASSPVDTNSLALEAQFPPTSRALPTREWAGRPAHHHGAVIRAVPTPTPQSASKSSPCSSHWRRSKAAAVRLPSRAPSQAKRPPAPRSGNHSVRPSPLAPSAVLKTTRIPTPPPHGPAALNAAAARAAGRWPFPRLGVHAARVGPRLFDRTPGAITSEGWTG
jgi:hypothetical protein